MTFRFPAVLALLCAPAVYATCLPPPPSLTFDLSALPVSERALGLIEPLTGDSSPYSCPFPVIQPDGSMGWEMRVAYTMAFHNGMAITHALNDEALSALVPGSGVSRTWDSATRYQAGEQVSWQGLEYRSQWWTQGEAPGVPGGPWQGIPPATLMPWHAAVAYPAGEQVIYDGRLWQSKWWTQNEAPTGQEWGAWQQAGVPPYRPGVFSARIQTSGGNVAHFSVVSAVAGERAPDYVEVRQNGEAIGRLDQFQPFSPPCEASTCPVYWSAHGDLAVQGWRWMSTGPDSLGLNGYFSVWACATDGLCRPSRLTAVGLGRTSRPNPVPALPVFP
ncbi:carbohydrate-binding protein [Chitinibacteraceae bacterium HSL-7]